MVHAKMSEVGQLGGEFELGKAFVLIVEYLAFVEEGELWMALRMKEWPLATLLALLLSETWKDNFMHFSI
jgi:hypothetical protein